MKKLVLLPLLLLASCATTPATSPFKAGDTFTVTGNTLDRQNVALNVVLRDNGDLDEKYWYYDADGSSTDSAYVRMHQDLDYVYVVDQQKGVGGQADMVTACHAFPNDRNWRSLNGRLIRMTLTDYKAFWKRVDPLTGSEFTTEFNKVAGDCTITRK